MIDLPQLQALSAAVDTGTFDAAARRLHVTPSAISQRIRALENSVGSILLTRLKVRGAAVTKGYYAGDGGQVLRDLKLDGKVGSLASNIRRFFTRGFKSYVSRKGYREGGWGVLLVLAVWPMRRPTAAVPAGAEAASTRGVPGSTVPSGAPFVSMPLVGLRSSGVMPSTLMLKRVHKDASGGWRA